MRTRRLPSGSALGPPPARPGTPAVQTRLIRVSPLVGAVRLRKQTSRLAPARGRRPSEARAEAGAPAHVGRPFPRRARGARATPSLSSAAAPTGPRMLSRFSPPAG